MKSEELTSMIKGGAAVRSTLATVMLAGVAFVVPQIAIVVLAGLIGGILGWNSIQLNEWSNTTVGQFLFVLVAEVLLVSTVLLIMRLRRERVVTIGLRRPRVSDAGYAFIAFAIYFMAYIAVAVIAKLLLPSLNFEQEQNIGFKDVQGTGQLALTFLSLVVLAPIAEEVLFRGFLFSNLRRYLPVVVAAVMASLLFAAAHLPSGVGGLLWVGALDTFVLSMVLCALRVKTNAIIAGILVHAIKNFLAFYVLFLR